MTLAMAWGCGSTTPSSRTRSESATAYGDTVGDLTLGWAGAVVAALLVGVSHPATRMSSVPVDRRPGIR